MENTEISEIKGILKKNPYATILGCLSLLILILIILNITEFYFGNATFKNIILLLPLKLWIFFLICMIGSTIAAYTKKYSLVIAFLLLFLLTTNIYVRSANFPYLVNVATNESTLGPDLDPFLYLRVAEEINNGDLNYDDNMRYPPVEVKNFAFSSLMPWTILGFYKIISMFGDKTIIDAANITPVILATIATIGFFFFMFVLFSSFYSNKKSGIFALISSAFYCFIPEMLHRTTGGIPEIEGLGMAFFWFAFGFFLLSLKKESNKQKIIYGLLAGLSTGLMSWSWGGYRYIYMILVLATLIMFFIDKDRKQLLLTYIPWLVPALLIEYLKVLNIFTIITAFTHTGFGLFILAILVIDYILHEFGLIKKIKLDKIKIPQKITSLIITILIGTLGLIVINPTFALNLIPNIIEGLLYPFGKGRVGLTIAENKSPYLTEILASFGKMFWVFLIGIIIIFYECVKQFDWKRRWLLLGSFIILIISLFFSKISETNSILNGDSFTSHLLYIGGILFFIGILIYVYLRAFYKKDHNILEKFKQIDSVLIILLVSSFWMAVSLRGAIRLLFIVSPFIVIISIFLLAKTIDYYKKRNKESSGKIFFGIAGLILIAILISTFFTYFSSTEYMVKNGIPSVYNQQWQYSMNWVEKNTPENSIFIHWWDYGYWVQTLGKRATVTDGGHYVGHWDHLTGRYLLTTPYPETALSLMKTYNVSYLLIDSTDLGKYSAYSSIGDDEEISDRMSFIPVIPLDATQTRETNNSQTLVYAGGSGVDADIIYNLNGEEIFLPQQKTILIGFIVEVNSDAISIEFNQPLAVFVYNEQQYRIPIRYVQIGKDFKDFNKGLNATIKIIPSISNNNGYINKENLGAVIYLSPKVSPSLFAQIYILNDSMNKYPTLKLVNSEDDPLVKHIKYQGVDIDEFIYYQGFRGPIKIWEVNYPSNIITHNEFLATSGGYGELDNLTFTK